MSNEAAFNFMDDSACPDRRRAVQGLVRDVEVEKNAVSIKSLF